MYLIEKLTDKQKAKFPEYIDKWTKIGLCTDPANRIEAEKAIIESYIIAGLKPPRKIVWCGSPLSQGLTKAIILDKEMWASVGDSVWDSGYGQHDANWLGFYEYFRKECNLIGQTNKLQGLTKLSKNAGWFLPHQNICWVSERHCLLNKDERGRLHSLSKPAVLYPDGWAIYAVHGVRVPSEIIEHPEKITVKNIEQEANTEIRRVKIEIFGQERFLKESGSIEIHSDNYGTLWRKELQDDEPIIMVELTNSTPEPDGQFKHYFLRVPPQIETAHQAVAWTFGKTIKDYQPLIMS